MSSAKIFENSELEEEVEFCLFLVLRALLSSVAA